MPKLIFTYGTMGSAKTTNALIKFYELTTQNKRVLLLKPKTDNRDGITTIKSRIGISAQATIFDDSQNIKQILINCGNIDTIIVDEAQFCSAHHVEELKDITIYNKIPVYAFGLKTNFKSELFEGSKRFVEIADELRFLEMTCVYCENAAEINARFADNGSLIEEGAVVEIGGNEKYKALCYKCWQKEKAKNKK